MSRGPLAVRRTLIMLIVLATSLAGCADTFPAADADDARVATAAMLTGFENRSSAIAEWIDPECEEFQYATSPEAALTTGLIAEFTNTLLMQPFAEMSEQDFADIFLMDASTFLVDEQPSGIVLLSASLAFGYFDAAIANVNEFVATIELTPTERSNLTEPVEINIRWKRLGGDVVLARCPYGGVGHLDIDIESTTAEMLIGFAERSDSLESWIDPNCEEERVANSSSAVDAATDALLRETFADYTDQDFAELYGLDVEELPGASLFPEQASEPVSMLSVQWALASGFYEANVDGSEDNTVVVTISPSPRSTLTDSVVKFIEWTAVGDRVVLVECGFTE